MAPSKEFILRVQSPEGTKRLNVRKTESSKSLLQKASSLFGLDVEEFALYRKPNKQDEIIPSRTTLKALCLEHGDMLYLTPHEKGSTSQASTSYSSPLYMNGKATSRSRVMSTTQEDPIDVLLHSQSGKIQRKRDPHLCKHGTNALCVHCAPLEPWDAAYIKEKNIKHLSFHQYIRKITSGADGGKFAVLEDITCRIKPGCSEHPPWPQGICSKCQPSAITLSRQQYRHVDNIMFENPELVERFLGYWRETGQQRLGFLYGRYELHKDVPLAIKATVTAIYEPPQESTKDSITLLVDEKEDLVDSIAQQLGVVRVGWMFTDLIPEDVSKGTVQHVRGAHSHFLSAQECVTAAYYQNKHPNPCRLSTTGYFGSKFSTIVVTGDSNHQIHMEGYQVSGQCMALVRDHCLVPTRDAPELGYVIESSPSKYVPDVFYTVKDEYGNEVSKLARPLPVEYMLVDVPTATPLEPQYTFCADRNIKPFPVENRLVDGHLQDFAALCTYLQQFQLESRKRDYLTAFSDFHFLLYIANMDMLPMKDYLSSVLTAVKNGDEELAYEWAQSEQWQTVVQLMAASPGEGAPPSSSQHASWTCAHCTFLNQNDGLACDMCGLPKNG